MYSRKRSLQFGELVTASFASSGVPWPQGAGRRAVPGAADVPESPRRLGGRVRARPGSAGPRNDAINQFGEVGAGMSPRGYPLGDISKTATSLEARAPTQRPPAAGERSPHVSGGAAPGGEPSLEPICVVRPTWASARASIVSPLLPRLAHTV